MVRRIFNRSLIIGYLECAIASIFVLFMHPRDEIVIVIYGVYNCFSFDTFSWKFTYRLNKSHKPISSMCSIWTLSMSF